MYRNRRLLRVALTIGLVIAVCCMLHPVHSRKLQAGVFAGWMLVWFSTMAAVAGRKRILVCVALLPLLALVPFLLPGRQIDAAALRDGYVMNLRDFDGATYVWGGESPLGIDCSGLPRRALRDALWSEGMRHANGRAFRLWLDLWFIDSSARAMGRSHRGNTRPVGLTDALWRLDAARLLPGDLAIRTDGVHVVVYLGNDEWIEADPGRGIVRRWIPSENDGAWYDPMSVYRWQVTTEP
jgi:hypothetical protein